MAACILYPRILLTSILKGFDCVVAVLLSRSWATPKGSMLEDSFSTIASSVLVEFISSANFAVLSLLTAFSPLLLKRVNDNLIDSRVAILKLGMEPVARIGGVGATSLNCIGW